MGRQPDMLGGPKPEKSGATDTTCVCRKIILPILNLESHTGPVLLTENLALTPVVARCFFTKEG